MGNWWLFAGGLLGVLALARVSSGRLFTVIVDTRPSNVGTSTLDEIGAAVEMAVQSQLPGATFLGAFSSAESAFVQYYLYRGGSVAPGLTSSFAETVTRWLSAVVLSRVHVAGVTAVLGNVTPHRELGALSGLPRMATGGRRR